MMRPGTKVNSPAIKRAPAKMLDHGAPMTADIVAMGGPDRERQHHQREDRQEMDRTPDAPHSELLEIQNELKPTIAIRVTHTKPIVRWGNVPFGAESCTMPNANAVRAAKACS